VNECLREDLAEVVFISERPEISQSAHLRFALLDTDLHRSGKQTRLVTPWHGSTIIPMGKPLGGY
jgi:hypothetical protein